MVGMSMYSDEEIEKLNSKWQTRGMRKEWFGGVEGLMTVVRVLPPELYDRVVSGKDVPDGALAVERSETRHVEGWGRRLGRDAKKK